jgi:hypothetical protein
LSAKQAVLDAETGSKVTDLSTKVVRAESGGEQQQAGSVER